jgi:pyrroline-5-carboxylate reductase
MKKKIGIIGFGNMGSAIAGRIKPKYEVLVFDKDREKTKNLTKINVADNLISLISQVEVSILAVKPQDFDVLLNDMSNYVNGKLIISIAAGITTKYIENRLGQARVIRVMPNLPIKIGKGMSCICRGESAKEDDLNFTEKLFKKIGKTLILSESMVDAATAISGSGPGYLYDESEGKSLDEIKKYAKEIFIPALTASAHELGFSSEESQILAEVTGIGSIAFLEKTGLSPSELKKQVASKGGTTEAALEVLHKGGSLLEAVKAAKKRAEELSPKE